MEFYELDTYHKGVVETEAKAMGVDPLALWECYLETIDSNFEQDIHDVAKDNEEFFKGRGV